MTTRLFRNWRVNIVVCQALPTTPGIGEEASHVLHLPHFPAEVPSCTASALAARAWCTCECVGRWRPPQLKGH